MGEQAQCELLALAAADFDVFLPADRNLSAGAFGAPVVSTVFESREADTDLLISVAKLLLQIGRRIWTIESDFRVLD